MITPSPSFMEHTLRVIRMHVRHEAERGRPPHAASVDEACRLALHTQTDTLQEIAAYKTLETLFPDEFRAARITTDGPTQEGA